ncbi:ATPase involved in chromosome partitioning (plasmid) [Desulfosporosinus acidiphilus SJ4]|uniref:ATPase involved in chromosome partitioning n=1 Tax=Desulfosporosinus acidiphilus (strain DSM 22704 / JCM 16185 / SJ4) TaxID=646529 RepID=I4DCR8_DESAJ|nr:ParA family protein [Desulfosporosinus acidiphilus]AFM43592.1 ATPase involved in chromosome partitioning [Desulfosporosinus acidiphilus SJ4]
MAGISILNSFVKKDRKAYKLKPKCRVIAPLSQKGGATKSTSCVNIASVLCEMGYRVLVIDLDQQGHSTMGLGGDNLEWEYTMANVLDYEKIIEDFDPIPIEKALMKTLFESKTDGSLWLIGANITNEEYSAAHYNDPSKKMLLSEELDKIKDKFDFIIIDSPPGLDFWNWSAIFALDYIIVPLEPGHGEMRSYNDFMETLLQIKEVNPKLKHLGTFLTKANPQTNLYKDFKQNFEVNTPGILFESEIPQDTKIKESLGYGIPVTLYASSSKSSKSYWSLTEEVLKRCQLIEAKG